MAEQPHIKYLSIRKFRGIDLLEWRPDEQINILIGGGDSGKSKGRIYRIKDGKASSVAAERVKQAA